MARLDHFLMDMFAQYIYRTVVQHNKPTKKTDTAFYASKEWLLSPNQLDYTDMFDNMPSKTDILENHTSKNLNLDS